MLPEPRPQAEGAQVGVVPGEASPQGDAAVPDSQALRGQPRSGWRKRLGVEPSLPSKSAATGFEDREGHRAPFASIDDHTVAPPVTAAAVQALWMNETSVSTSRRSPSTRSGSCARSSSRLWPPVATATTRAPAARAQAMSNGVSPTTTA